MKKSIVIIVSILIAIIIMGTFVYAVKDEKQNKIKSFLSIDKEEAAVGDIVTMTLDLAQVSYDEFVLTIQADKQIIDNSEINAQTENEVTFIEEGKITLEKENDVTIKLFANKQNLKSNEIKLCFVVPETLNIGDKINLYATIEEVKEEEKIDDENNELQEENTEQKPTQDDKIEEVTVTITIIEKSKKDNTMNANAINLENVMKEQPETKKNTSSSSSSVTSNKSKTIPNNTEETYKGSSNKYLSNIEVEGYQLIPNFNITNTTYFLEVENNVTSLNITTEKYDSSEIVTIYGNDDLKTGTNKILINVTAEDGTTKTYRIYVTKK